MERFSYVANLLINCFTTNAQNRAPDHVTNDTSHNNQHWTMRLTIPFFGALTTQLVKKLKRKLRRCLVDPNVDIRIKEKTTKLCFFTSTKDKTLQLSQSKVVYEFICPGQFFVHRQNEQNSVCPHTRTCAIVIRWNAYKVYTTYRIFSSYLYICISEDDID